jgi:hypothetical protein
MAFGNEGDESVRFKHKKISFYFKAIFICWFNFFAFQRPFVKL